MKQFVKYLFLLSTGGTLYYFVEIIARGYSHWTMFLVGGICFIVIGLLNEATPKMPLIRQMLLSTLWVTVIEFVAGCVINLWLGWNIWDYSDRAFNFMGQICLKNSCYWFLLSAVAVYIDDMIRYLLFGEERPHYDIV
ncbi:putative ABC transporter permease [Bariatricus massiliensis]|uniref:ABC transporter permease n=1 Tax=Bariatricus massiliensis TaxID=1745713 RepID=A0ABS8DD92_9FIRM|nr:hypothetical protein [Bariatricus massiliensis]MCB7302491.1 putative ABC transporter permease [Bariatricus massiliensis]MCB7373707.1 putative ABC transporter permease [Bariatricus massiliensis]MCB7386377.1 putative ABC transporter permease [Bariatricus massiliensis]MCB7410539.1 putative ABC transporter permease [Bariatricus massiliensis]MCQ5253624.1 putative ABC transporter permease [Bariatricus massiliensis]